MERPLLGSLCVLSCLALFAGIGLSSADEAHLPDDPWHHDLSLPGVDVWRARIPIDVVNLRAGDLSGFPVGIEVGEDNGQVNVAGAVAHTIRVSDTNGTEMLFDLRTQDGHRLTNGTIPASAVLTVPVTAQQGGSQRLYVYFDNPDAYQVPDFVLGRSRPTTIDNLEIRVGSVEQLELKSAPMDAPFLTLSGHTWETRLPVIVVNTGDRMNQVLVQAPMGRLEVLFHSGFHPGSVRVFDPETQQALPYLVAGDHLIFAADVPSRSIKFFHIYISRDPEIPAGPALEYGDLISQPGNLAVNPSFEQGGELPQTWSNGGVGLHERTGGGILGEHFVRTTVPLSGPVDWTGWRQQVTVQPGADYLFMAYVRTTDITGGSVLIHAHILEETANGAERRYWSAGPGLTGTTDWQLLGGVISVPPRASTVEMHLTMNTRGTLDHDGVVMMQTTLARLGEIETDPSVARDAFSVWPENPLVKVFQDTPPMEESNLGRTIDLYAARGEQEVLQLVLRSHETMNVEVTIDGPSNANGHLPAPRMEKVGYVPVLQPSGYHNSASQDWERRVVAGGGRTDGWLGWWPDYLAPMDRLLELPAHRTQPLWITFTVPKDARPGLYTGTIKVTGDAQERTIPFTLRVWRFVLPDRPSLQAVYDLRTGPGWSTAQTAEEREEWWRFMAARRVSADHILPDPEFRLVDGRVTMDATEFDRAAELYFDELHMAAAYFPPVFYAAGWAHPPSSFLGLPHGSPGYGQAYEQAVRLFWNHIQSKGWADRMVLYLSDEPHYETPEVVETLGNLIRLIREVDPEIPVYSSTWGYIPEWEGVLNHWGIAQYGRFPLDVLKRRLAAGDKVWFTTDGQMEINTPYLATERLLPYYSFAYGVDGYEFWGISWYTYNPFQFGWHSFIEQSIIPGQPYWTRYPNGDGYLAYPGALIGIDGPLSTIRLEQAREGLEDYEIYAALQHLAEIRPALQDPIQPVLEEVRSLATIPNAGGYRSTQILPDPHALLETRKRAGELLDRLLVSEHGAALSGKVVDPLGRSIDDMTITFSGGTAGEVSSDAGGNWHRDGVKGYAVVVPRKAGWTFTPSQIQAPAGTSDLRFVATPPPPQVHFERLRDGAEVKGDIHPRVKVELPEPPAKAELKSLTIRLDDAVLYTGGALPEDFSIDTSAYPDGAHTLAVVMETDYGAAASTSVRVTVDNWWEIDDPLKPPLESSFFGTFDYSMTSAESPGWAYATDHPEDVGGDVDRKVRKADTAEYLVWETPHLKHFSVRIYSTRDDLSDILNLSVAGEGQDWRPIPYELQVEKPLSTRWFVHQIRGTIAADLPVRYFRLTLSPGGVPGGDVQIGRVELVGLANEE